MDGSVSEFLGFRAGQVDNPSLGLLCDDRYSRRMQHVLQTTLWPCSDSLVYAFIDRWPAHTQALLDGHDTFSLRISKNNCSTLNLSGGCSSASPAYGSGAYFPADDRQTGYSYLSQADHSLIDKVKAGNSYAVKCSLMWLQWAI